MARKQSVNGLSEGIKADQHPSNMSNAAMSDALNNTIITGKGNELINQVVKSNRPYTSQYGIDLEASFEEGIDINTFGPIIDNGTVTVPTTNDVYKVYFRLFRLTGERTAYIELTFNYDDTSSEIFTIFPYNTLQNDNIYYTPSRDGGKVLTSIDWRLFNFPVIVGSNGTNFFYIGVEYLAVSGSEAPIGIPINNKILGTKTFNDVTYIISGKTSNNYIERTRTNNVSKTPYDDWDRVPSGYTDDSRDSLSAEDITIESSDAISDTFDVFQAYTNDRVGAHTLQNLNINVRAGQASTEGVYLFRLSGRSQLDKYTNINEHYVKLKLSYRPIGSSTYTDISGGWDVDENEKVPLLLFQSNIITFDLTAVILAGAPEGVEFFIRGEAKVNDRGRIGINVDATIETIDKPFTINSGGTVNFSVGSSPASTNYTADGSITVSNTEVADNIQVAIDYNAFVGPVPFGGGAGSDVVFSNLPSGTYTVYVQNLTNGKYSKQTVTISTTINLPDLSVRVIITDKSYVPTLEFMYWRWILEDTSTPYTGRYIYSSRMPGGVTASKPATYDFSETSQSIVTTDGIARYSVEDQSEHVVNPSAPGPWAAPTSNIGGGGALPYSATVYDAEYKRKVQLDIPIQQEKLIDKAFYTEIGTFPSPNYEEDEGDLLFAYRPLNNYNNNLFICDKIHLSGTKYLDIEIQPSYDGTVNIIYTDDENLPRLVNSGFTVLPDNKFEIIDRIGERDTNKYTSSNVEVTTRLIQNPAFQITVNPKAVKKSGGKLEVGMYKYFVKLGTLDENETDFIEETGYIPVFIGNDMGSLRGGPSGKETESSIELKIDNIDSSFAYVRLYVLINSGDDINTVLTYRIDQKFIIPTPSVGRQTVNMSVTHTGFEGRTLIDTSELSIQKNIYEKLKTITQIDNRLFIANLSQPDVDYKQLFEVGRKIVAVPSIHNDFIRFNMLLEKWGVDTTDDLRVYSQLYYNQKLDNITLPDLNKMNPAQASNIFTVGFSQSHHNPLFVEKYSMYWPYETYTFRVCFILDNDSITYPVPVIGGDYSNFFTGVDTDYDEASIYSGAQKEWDSSTMSYLDGVFQNEDTDNWEENRDWKILYNKLGVVRFPKQKYANAAFFPKFKFSLDDFEGIDPGLLARIKGFFFVRGERKPDLIMEGILGRCGLLTSSPIAFDERQDLLKLPSFQVFNGDVLNAIPLFYGKSSSGNQFVLSGYEIIDTAAAPAGGFVKGDPINDPAGTYILSKQYNYSFINSMAVGPVAVNKNITSYYSDSGKQYHKFWFRSGDIYADFPAAASIFNGSKFGLLSLCQPVTDGSSFFGLFFNSSYFSTISVHDRVTDPGIGGVVPVDTLNHILRVLKPGSYPGNDPDGFFMRGLTDYVEGNSYARSGGGFSTQVGYRSNIITDTTTGLIPVNIWEVIQISGNYPTYVGITVEDPESLKSFPDYPPFPRAAVTTSPEGLYSVYPSDDGPLTTDQLKSLYSSDQGLTFTAITPRYLFEDFPKGKTEIITDSTGANPITKENIINVMGARGDCYVNMNTHNISKSLPAISGDPTVEHPHLADDADEYNSYRAGEASITLQVPHRNNWLSYARHPEITDETEAALYNKARSFPPLYGAGDKFLGATRGNKLPETTAFNKGYRAHFEGRKYVGVSHDVPFVRGADANSIAFSEQYSRDSFYNGYRDFLGLNERSYKKEFGAITKIIEYGGNLIGVFQKGIALIGINDQTVVGQNQGGNVLVDNANVMNRKATPISNFIGSDWIRSVLRTDNTVYGVDVENNKIWRLDGYNINIISDNAVSGVLYGFLEGFRGRKEIPGELYVASFYDRTKKEVIFSFYNKNSRYTDIPLPMDPDIYYMLLDLGSEGARQQWVDDANADPEEELRRHTLKERFDLIQDEMDIHPSIQNHLTLIFSENSGTWTTRWNISPEFMFNLGSKLYSINNQSLLSDLGLAGGINALDNYLDLFGSSLIAKDPYDLIIWEHESVKTDIPQWGSLYAQKPVYEIEYILNEESAIRKIVDNLLIEGPKSEPYEAIYQTSGEPQWLHYVLDTTDPTGAFATWLAMQQGYTDRIINTGIRTVDPNAFIQQTINPRDRYSISKANYDYYNGLNKIIVAKDIDYMYILPSTRQKYRLSNIQDNWIKIRIRYNNGKFTAIKAIYTLFRTIN